MQCENQNIHPISRLLTTHNTDNCEVMSTVLGPSQLHNNIHCEEKTAMENSIAIDLRFSGSMVPRSFCRVDASTAVEWDYGIVHVILLRRLAHGR